MISQKWEQKLGNIFRRCGVRLDPNGSEMFRKRQHNPIAKMTIKRDQRSLLLHGTFKNQRVVSPCLAGFGRANDIMPSRLQK